jgi:organic radical activating enzyme
MLPAQMYWSGGRMNKLPSKTFCVLPWMHISTQPNGPVVLCCESKMQGGINQARNIVTKNGIPQEVKLNLADNSLGEIMNSDFYKGCRTGMLKGEIPEACMPCFDKEARKIRSKRGRENKRYGHLIPRLLDNTNPDGSLKELDLTFLELRLGNVCNVRCRTCNPNSSSQWWKDYPKLIKTKEFSGFDYDKIEGSYDWHESKKFWAEVLKNAHTIEEIYINGGEPTLIKAHWKALNQLVESGHAEHIDLWYSVNMTKMPEDKIQVWKEFRKTRIEASIDDLEDRNHYIRYPTKWEDVLKSIDTLQRNKIDWGIMQTVSAMNIYYLPEFQTWANSLGANVSLNFVFDPYYLSPAALPLTIKEEIYKKLEANMPERYMDDIFGVLKPYLDYTEEFCIFTKEMDEIRGQSFKKTFPEVAAMLNCLKIEIS